MKTVAVRHPGRWVAAAVMVVLGAMLVNTVLTNPRFEWSVVGRYLTDGSILTGLARTLQLTAIATVIGVALGVLLAIMRLSSNPLVSLPARLYIWFFRGTPLLIQIIFWFNISALYPRLSLGIPFGPEFVSGNVNSFVTALLVATLALGLNQAAYMAEIVRGGILSVDEGQTDAAYALGMSRLRMLRLIVLPQAMRVILPPMGNETITMLKMTSLVSVISLNDLLYSAQIIYTRTYETIPLLIVASLWYLAVTTVLTFGQRHLERRFGKGQSGHDGRPSWAEFLGVGRWTRRVREPLTGGGPA